MTAIELRSIVVNDVQLTFLERQASEATDKPPFLLLHGIAASACTLQNLIAELSQDRRVVALNLPGTDAPTRLSPSDLTLPGLANFVRAVANSLGLDHPVILGHSHGGAIALQIAASFPDFPSALILLCPAHPFLLRERRLIAFYNSWFGQLFAHSLRWAPKAFQGIGFNRLLGPAGRKAGIDFKPYREPFQRRDNVAQVLRMLKTWSSDMDALGRQIEQHNIVTPTLFLWGDHDTVVPIATASVLQKHMQSWQMFTLPGVGHLPNDEATSGCASLIKTWLI